MLSIGVWHATRKPHSFSFLMASPELSQPSEHKLSVLPENGDRPTKSMGARVQRAQWLRAAILGASDGLLSTSSLMIGVSSAKEDQLSMIVAGVAGTVAGAFSMAVGEFVSVSTQRDIEREAVNKSQSVDKVNVVKEPVAEALTPGRSPMMRAMAIAVDHEMETLPNPVKAAAASGLAFMVGSALPLLSGGFIKQYQARVLALVAVTTAALVALGGAGALLGGSRRIGLSAARVLIGGWVAMGVTYLSLKLLDVDDLKT